MGALSPISIAGFIFSVNSALYLFFVDSSNLFAIYILIFFILYLAIYWSIGSRVRSPARVIRISDKLYGEKIVLALGISSGCYAVMLLIINSGQTDLLAIASYYSKLRYVEDIGMPVVVRIANVFLYFSLMVTSLIFFERKRFLERATWYFIPAILLIFESFLLGTKSILIMLMVYFFISYHIVNMYHGATANTSMKFIKILFSVFIVFVLVLTTHYIRASGNMSIFDIIIKVLTSYFLLPSFAFIQEAETIESLLNIGAYSISGISVYISDDIVKRGEYVYINVFGDVYQTNVYTAMFYLTKDFGHVGFFFVMMLSLYLMLYFERRIKRGTIFVGSVYIPLAAIYIFSFADPVFKELTNVLSHMLLILYFIGSYFVYRSKNKFSG